MTEARDFRVVPASTGLVVQCACGWYSPFYDHDPAALHAEHVRIGCYDGARTRPLTETPERAVPPLTGMPAALETAPLATEENPR